MRTEPRVTPPFAADAVIVGGCGRAGLPLGVALASRGLSVRLYDINPAAVAVVNSGRMPFTEPGAAEPLRAAVSAGLLVRDDRSGQRLQRRRPRRRRRHPG